MTKYFLNHCLVFSLSVFCVATWSQPVQADNSLRDEIEEAMRSTRKAIIDGDLASFRSSLDPLNPKSKLTPEIWEQVLNNAKVRKLLIKSVPNLVTETRFLKIKIEGEWAGYYAEGELSDKQYQSLEVLLFHKSVHGWRFTGKSYGLVKAKPGGELALQGMPAWKGNDDMLRTIEENGDFSLKKMIEEIKTR